jgi:hypothetical protein
MLRPSPSPDDGLKISGSLARPPSSVPGFPSSIGNKMVRRHERHGTAEWGRKGQSVKLIVIANRINTNYSEPSADSEAVARLCEREKNGWKKVELCGFSEIENAKWSGLVVVEQRGVGGPACPHGNRRGKLALLIPERADNVIQVARLKASASS